MVSNAQKMAARPVLIVVMGTSGSGKSTFGAALASALEIPFVDGDDLHPKANVEKMSRGEPLNDEDRLPWLLSIREKAIAICQGEAERHIHEHDRDEQEKERIRRLAEVNETSHQPKSKGENEDTLIAKASEWKRKGVDKNVKGEQQDLNSGDLDNGTTAGHSREACIIACSALKASYRHLLRFGLDVAQGKHHEDEEDDTLDVHHIYLNVSPDELLRRMHERKGHFMKEGMLKSQLQTLQDPTNEPKTLVLGQGETEMLLNEAKQYLEPILRRKA